MRSSCTGCSASYSKPSQSAKNKMTLTGLVLSLHTLLSTQARVPVSNLRGNEQAFVGLNKAQIDADQAAKEKASKSAPIISDLLVIDNPDGALVNDPTFSLLDLDISSSFNVGMVRKPKAKGDPASWLEGIDVTPIFSIGGIFEPSIDLIENDLLPDSTRLRAEASFNFDPFALEANEVLKLAGAGIALVDRVYGTQASFGLEETIFGSIADWTEDQALGRSSFLGTKSCLMMPKLKTTYAVEGHPDRKIRGEFQVVRARTAKKDAKDLDLLKKHGWGVGFGLFAKPQLSSVFKNLEIGVGVSYTHSISNDKDPALARDPAFSAMLGVSNFPIFKNLGALNAAVIVHNKNQLVEYEAPLKPVTANTSMTESFAENLESAPMMTVSTTAGDAAEDPPQKVEEATLKKMGFITPSAVGLELKWTFPKFSIFSGSVSYAQNRIWASPVINNEQVDAKGLILMHYVKLACKCKIPLGSRSKQQLEISFIPRLDLRPLLLEKNAETLYNKAKQFQLDGYWIDPNLPMKERLKEAFSFKLSLKVGTAGFKARKVFKTVPLLTKARCLQLPEAVGAKALQPSGNTPLEDQNVYLKNILGLIDQYGTATQKDLSNPS